MGWLARLTGTGAPRRWDGTAGRPPSGNGASSFHLFWDLPAGVGAVVAVEVTLEVVEPPATDDLVFWALQASFADGAGRPGGGAHLGLQWHRPHPGGTAVNWGGYRHGGGELAGSVSALPSAPGNVNTRDFPWRPGTPYRLRIEAVGPVPTAAPGASGIPGGLAAWRGSVTDARTGVTTVVRDLYAPGDRLVGPMVWSEVFAPCDAPGGAVRWSAPTVVAADGGAHPVREVSVNYQSLGDGGCVTTDSAADGRGGIVQRTGTARRTPHGARLTLGPGPGPEPEPAAGPGSGPEAG